MGVMMMGASRGDAGERRGRAEGDLCGGKKGGCQLPPQCPPDAPPTGSASFPRPLPALGGVCSRSGDGGADVSGSGCRAAAAPPGPEPRGEPGPPPQPSYARGQHRARWHPQLSGGGCMGGGYPVRPEDALWLLTAAFPAAGGGGGGRGCRMGDMQGVC